VHFKGHPPEVRVRFLYESVHIMDEATASSAEVLAAAAAKCIRI